MLFSFQPHDEWSQTQKWAFRFVALYSWLYILMMFGGSRLLKPLTIWLGRDVLGIEGRYEFFATGSGDTTMAYAGLFTQLILVILGTILWSVLNRKRRSYNAAFYWFTVILRIFLVFFMFTYGFAKIYKSQFAGPSLLRLLQPIGDMSPMGLAWTYMAQSEGFNMFTGFMEVLGGLLLIPKRTQALGGIVVFGVMLQIFMMNMFYDIPVKLFSAHLMLFGLLIFAADWKRFSHVFIKNKPTEAVEYYKPTKDPVYHTVMMWFKVAGVAILFALMGYQGYNAEHSFGDKRPKPQYYGIWEAEEFVKNGDTIAPLITRSDRWRYLVIDRKGYAAVKMMNDSARRFNFIVDSTGYGLTMRSRSDTLTESNFTITQTDSIQLILKGVLDQDSLQIRLRARDLSQIRLINRGFHWINETPYNR
ncbi:hypothetical protein [Gilvibacter sp.]|uniref:hypothetical protein n=1 Tax=Gilvibacter sp. TaxID=2729997 RepID=UPI003F49C1AE